MHKIAVIQFPGTNCEYESLRAVKKAGMQAELFRWNQAADDLRNFAGYFIPGGFSYEDRVRSGAIAARDPLLTIIVEEAAKGKLVIGICNGAQILVESGMIPGLNANHIGAGLAWNKKGYLSIWVNIKNAAVKGKCAFNNFSKGHHFRLPIAHGEGRYVVPQELLQQLIDNGQTVFRYCDANGEIEDEYPINPNGAVYNLAGVCNPAGNILALMPHPERTAAGQVIFQSMKNYLDLRFKIKDLSYNDLDYDISELELNEYNQPENSMEFLVDLIITDNEAQTLQTALSELGYGEIKIKRFTHFEIGVDKGIIKKEELADELIRSGELLNTNKEIPYINDRAKLESNKRTILVRYKDDFDGQDRLRTLQHRLGVEAINSIKKGVIWQFDCSDETWQKILNSNILFNPYSQYALYIIK